LKLPAAAIDADVMVAGLLEHDCLIGG